MDTKGTSNSTTLLHFLTETVERNFKPIGEFVTELEPCKEACKGELVSWNVNTKCDTDLFFGGGGNASVSVTEMNMELQDIATDLATLEKELKMDDYKDGDHQTSFISVMSLFHDNAKKRYQELEDLRKDMQSSYDSLVRFYGEDPGKMAPDEFFGIFSTFVTSWEVSCFKDREWSLILFMIWLEMLSGKSAGQAKAGTVGDPATSRSGKAI